MYYFVKVLLNKQVHNRNLKTPQRVYTCEGEVGKEIVHFYCCPLSFLKRSSSCQTVFLKNVGPFFNKSLQTGPKKCQKKNTRFGSYHKF